MDGDGTVSWLSLPPELWETIGRRLHSHTDVLRFRGVCSTWRSLLPPLPRLSPPLPAPSPLRRFSGPIATGWITSATVFRIEPSPQFDSPIPSPRGGWLIKVLDPFPESETDSALSGNEPIPKAKLGMVRLLSPLCSPAILYNYKQDGFPEHLDLMKFRAIEVCKEHSLWTLNHPISHAEKVLVSPTSPWHDPGDTIVILINKGCRLLRYWKYGQDRWGLITDHRSKESRYDDIMLYKGQFYVVDKFGTVSWIDSSMNIVQFSPLMCGGGNRKHLMELDGDIIVIDRYCQDRFEEVIEFKVYRLDQDWGKWDEVRDLQDKALFLGTGCSFAASIHDLDGFHRNCIYFVQVDGLIEKVFAFSLANRSIERTGLWPLHIPIMWPPPDWFCPHQS